MKQIVVLGCLYLAVSAWAQATKPPVHQDLGVVGPTYAITEPDLLQQIKSRLQTLMDSGEWARLQAQAQERLRQAVREPTPIPLAHTRTPRSFTFDPSITLDRNLLDPHGRLIHAAGTRLNPLSVVNLSKRLVFFDGRDAQQTRLVERLIREGANASPRITWLAVATGGSPPELMKRWGRTVYFDQQGRLTQRLGITQVPALVRQDGLLLRIDEVQP
jgi:conjugal transfer pilus assembly protein TraW